VLEDARRPLVGDDVVQAQREDVPVVGEPDEGTAEQPALGEVEAGLPALRDERVRGLPGLGLSGYVDHVEWERCRWVDDLCGDAVGSGDESGA
jgi:hypothetical protein